MVCNVCVTSGVCVSPHRDGVDVAGVSGEGLLAGAFPQVPHLGQGVAGSRDEGVHVGGHGQWHAVSNVVGEDDLLLAGLQVPQTAERREERSVIAQSPIVSGHFYVSKMTHKRPNKRSRAATISWSIDEEN